MSNARDGPYVFVLTCKFGEKNVTEVEYRGDMSHPACISLPHGTITQTQWTGLVSAEGVPLYNKSLTRY